MITIQPAKNVVVLKESAPEETPSGIIINHEANEKVRPKIGVVVAIGKGVKPVPFEVGDQIVYENYTDNPVRIGMESFNCIHFKNVLGRVEQK